MIEQFIVIWEYKFRNSDNRDAYDEHFEVGLQAEEAFQKYKKLKIQEAFTEDEGPTDVQIFELKEVDGARFNKCILKEIADEIATKKEAIKQREFAKERDRRKEKVKKDIATLSRLKEEYPEEF